MGTVDAIPREQDGVVCKLLDSIGLAGRPLFGGEHCGVGAVVW